MTHVYVHVQCGLAGAGKTSSNLKTFRRGLKEDFNPANKSGNQPNKKLKFNHSSLALKLNAQNANGPLESAFLFAHD